MAGEAPTTELEAINSIIGTIGEAPVDSLALTGLLFLDQAKSIFYETSRKVQMRGWDFNSETNYPMALNIDDEIDVPANVLKIDTTEAYADVDVVHRGTRLYNRTKHSYKFDSAIECDITFYLPFTDIPEAARNYIVVRAARIFQDRQLGTAILHGFTQKDEDEALAELKEANGDTGDYNVLTGNFNSLNTLMRDI